MDPRRTSEPGYMSNPNNIGYDEQMYIVRGLRNKDHKHNIILDLTEEKIIKNSFRTEKTFEELFAHYVNEHGSAIDQRVNQLNESLQIK